MCGACSLPPKRKHTRQNYNLREPDCLQATRQPSVDREHSFSPYGKESQQCVRIAQHNGAKSLIITDNPLSPLAKRANAMLLVNEGRAFAFRSLSATLCLCQALFIALAYRLELSVNEIQEQAELDN